MLSNEETSSQDIKTSSVVELFDKNWKIPNSELQQQLKTMEKARRSILGSADKTQPTLRLTESYFDVGNLVLQGPLILTGEHSGIKIEGFIDGIFLAPDDRVLVSNLTLLLKRGQAPLVNDFGHNVEMEVLIEYLN